MVASVIAIALLHEDLKDTTEALDVASEKIEVLNTVIVNHQKALESHKVVIEAHDGALGLVFDHFENTFL